MIKIKVIKIFFTNTFPVMKELFMVKNGGTPTPVNATYVVFLIS